MTEIYLHSVARMADYMATHLAGHAAPDRAIVPGESRQVCVGVPMVAKEIIETGVDQPSLDVDGALTSVKDCAVVARVSRRAVVRHAAILAQDAERGRAVADVVRREVEPGAAVPIVRLHGPQASEIAARQKQTRLRVHVRPPEAFATQAVAELEAAAAGAVEIAVRQRLTAVGHRYERAGH